MPQTVQISDLLGATNMKGLYDNTNQDYTISRATLQCPSEITYQISNSDQNFTTRPYILLPQIDRVITRDTIGKLLCIANLMHTVRLRLISPALYDII